MKYLKQSTSAVVPFGPALLPADGVTLVTSLVSALDHGTTGIFLCKNGTAAAIRHATVTATTYDAYGSYLVTLDTTDTNTLGRLRVMFAAAANTLPIWEDFTILPANVFDSIISGSTDLKVDVDQIKTQTVTCAAGVTVLASVGTAATSTAQTGDGYARIGAAGAGLTALGDTRIANLDATISSRTKPADTQAAVTLVTTTTNLTNAPTAGDLTATMKTSVTTAATSATPVAASVTGAVGSVTAGVALTSGERNSTADAILARTLGTESYAADGSVPTLAQALFALISACTEFSISGTTITCKQLNGSTTSMTYTLNDATSPTSRTRAT